MNDGAKPVVVWGAAGLTFLLSIGFGWAADDGLQPTFAAEMAAANMRMHHAMAIRASGDADRDFLQMMIPHHQGAVDMALLQLKYGRDEKIKRLAQSIIVEQSQEIAYMSSLVAGLPDQSRSSKSRPSMVTKE